MGAAEVDGDKLVELEFETTFDDLVRMRRYHLSGKRRSTAYWSATKLCSIGAGMLLLGINAYTWWLVAVKLHVGLHRAYHLVGGQVTWNLFIALYVLAAAFTSELIDGWGKRRRFPHILGRHRVALDEGVLSVHSDRVDHCLRLGALQRLEWANGDIFYYTEPRTPAVIPRHAFRDREHSVAVFNLFEAARQLQLAGSGFAATKGAWPPAPHDDQAPLPLPWPEMSTDSAIHLRYTLESNDYLYARRSDEVTMLLVVTTILAVVMGALAYIGPLRDTAPTIFAFAFVIVLFAASYRSKQSLSFASKLNVRLERATDVKLTVDKAGVRLQTPDETRYQTLTTLGKVFAFERIVVLQTGPAEDIIVPFRAFGSPPEARAFAKRLREAARAARLRGTITAPTHGRHD